MAIEIKGLKVTACHGVLPEEKNNPQLFEFDVKIECDTLRAALSDDVNLTVDYAKAATLVSDFCKANSFNLIESLAHGAAMLLLKNFESATCVQVTVHKPQAPIGLPFSDVTVSATAERNTVILSIGSSIGDKVAALNGAIEALSATEGILVEKVSPFVQSQPYGGVAKNTFLNCAVLIKCLLTPKQLLCALHKTEQKFMRQRNVRWEDRTLDIDIIFFGNKIIREEGLCVPHPDYANRDFVVGPIKSIAPEFVCPLTHRRISDM